MKKLLFYHINQLTHYVTNMSLISKLLHALKQITFIFFQEKIMPEMCLLSHFYTAIIAYTEIKSLAQHITSKNIYGQGEIQKRLELNNVGPLISIE